jgi:hypothetical protein
LEKGAGILKTGIRPLILCCAIGLALAWYVDLNYLPDHPLFPDEFRFLESAAHLRSTGEFLTQSLHAREMPLPAAFFAVLGPNLLLIRIVQAFAIPLQAWLLNAIGRRIFEPRVGLFAGCAACLYPYFLYFQGLALSETLFTTALLAFVAALYRLEVSPGRAPFVVGLGAVATYIKASLTFLPPFLLLPFVRPRVVLIGLFVYLLCLAPWWIRNYMVLHAFVPFSTTASMNLYVGNNPHTLTAHGDWSVDADPAEVTRIAALPGEIAQSQAYTADAISFIGANPGRFIELCVLRLSAFWAFVPNAEGYRSGILRWISALSTGPMLALALVGLVATRRAWRRLLPIYGLITYFTALHTLTIASIRYRLPIEPYLILLASAGAVACYDRLRRRGPITRSIETNRF